MGGSGRGFFYGDTQPEKIVREIRDKEEAAQNDAYNTEVFRIIRTLLNDANNRDVEAIRKHLETIESGLHKEIEGFIDLKYAGSVSKHTYVDGLSDIDSLAIINNSELSRKSPDEVKDYFYKMLRTKLPFTTIKIGHLAVTVAFKSGFEIQILPALKDGQGLRIPSSRRDNSWSHVIHPKKFALALRYSNIKMQGKLIPVIKLAKSVIASFSDQRRLSGYHVEALAIKTFLNYTGVKDTKSMLKHFFNEGSKNVLQPIKDKSGQSIHVDDYLGTSNSLNRKMISDSMATVARKMQNADGSREIRIWEQILK